MCIGLLFHTADASIGRVDKASFSDQTLMEMVIAQVTKKEKICGDASESRHIEEWKGVTIKDGNFIDIYWNMCDLGGSVHLEWLPPTVSSFAAGANRLTGTIDLHSLPDDLKKIQIGYNQLNGSVDLTGLPGKLQYLSLSGNKFSGGGGGKVVAAQA